jgi:hypothetical protein
MMFYFTLTTRPWILNNQGVVGIRKVENIGSFLRNYWDW